MVYLDQLREFTADLERLVSQPGSVLGHVLEGWPPEARVPAVYLISTPDDTRVVYAGMTVRQIVADRFHDHCHLRGGSNLRGILPSHPDCPQDPFAYRARWIAIDDPRERRFFESFAIGVLRPPFNR